MSSTKFIKLEGRTPECRQAYIEGVTAGILMMADKIEGRPAVHSMAFDELCEELGTAADEVNTALDDDPPAVILGQGTNRREWPRKGPSQDECMPKIVVAVRTPREAQIYECGFKTGLEQGENDAEK